MPKDRYRTTGNVLQLANMRSLCKPKIGMCEAFAKLVRDFFASRHALAKLVRDFLATRRALARSVRDFFASRHALAKSLFGCSIALRTNPVQFPSLKLSHTLNARFV
jgi:hypothetical protein